MSKLKRYLSQDILELRRAHKVALDNEYFNRFMDELELQGLPKETADYVMRQYWFKGTCAAWPIKHTNDIGFAPYATTRFDMYDFPAEVQLINKWNVPFMPKKRVKVGKEVIIGWLQPNHKPLKDIVDYYIERIVDVEMVINTNLQVHKLPFLFGITPEDKAKAEDLLARILNDEVAIFMDVEDLNMFKHYASTTPYIIDKLNAYKTALENELLTRLGIDNAIIDSTKERETIDEVNANNAIINLKQESLKTNLQAFFDSIFDTFGGTHIQVKPRIKPVESIHDNTQPDPVEDDKEVEMKTDEEANQ